MIIKHKQLQAHEGDPEHNLLVGSSLEETLVPEPPPPFEDESSESEPHHHMNLLENGEEPPPDFAPYEADYFETGSGDVVSHDPHLNSDGEALYRFLLAQADKTPSYRLHCRGTHSEYRTRWIRESNGEGRTESRRESYTETVTDFDFYIDASPYVIGGAIHWSVADSEPVYRGLMVREVVKLGGKQKAGRADTKVYKNWLMERKARGLPPWVMNNDGWREGMLEDSETLRSSQTLRQWADEYCASPKYLKEFVYDKVLYGWNIQQLENAIRSSIKGTMYRGHLQVEFHTHGPRIYIRPDNKFSRMLSNKWLKFLSIILLIYPFIWLFKRFHSRGGGRWEVCGGAYAMKRWVPLTGNEENYIPNNLGQSSSPRFLQTSNGMVKLMGLREGEWFRKWERTIIRAVIENYQSSIPLFDTGGPAFLDGY